MAKKMKVASSNKIFQVYSIAWNAYILIAKIVSENLHDVDFADSPPIIMAMAKKHMPKITVFTMLMTP